MTAAAAAIVKAADGIQGNGTTVNHGTPKAATAKAPPAMAGANPAAAAAGGMLAAAGVAARPEAAKRVENREIRVKTRVNS
jgi:hypothetical protein